MIKVNYIYASFVQILLVISFLFISDCSINTVFSIEENPDPSLNNTCILSGYISDRETKELLLGANILLNDGQYSTFTDFDGFFLFKNVLPGSYKVTTKVSGYRTYSISDVKLRDNYKYKLNIELLSDMQPL